jgi:2-C-methyl-D-erythritol 4-phosphate cytidylyltransferase
VWYSQQREEKGVDVVEIGVVIPAAGVGKRMNSTTPKQFMHVLGKPILIYTLEVFEQHPEITEICIVTNGNSYDVVKELVQTYQLKKVTHVVIGGKERQDSVYAGICSLATKWVMVHDAVRAFLTPTEIDRLIAVVDEQQPAATLAVPVKDTIKRVDDAGNVTETLPRTELWAIQTPQMFERALLLRAHQYAQQQGVIATDDAMLVEALGIPVKVVNGEYTNIKITTPEDIFVGEAILTKQKKGSVSSS